MARRGPKARPWWTGERSEECDNDETAKAGWEGLELEEEGGLSIGGVHSNQRGL